MFRGAAKPRFQMNVKVSVSTSIHEMMESIRESGVGGGGHVEEVFVIDGLIKICLLKRRCLSRTTIKKKQQVVCHITN